MAELKNGHLVREHTPTPERDERQLEMFVERPRGRAKFVALELEVEGDDETVAAALQLAAAAIGGRHG